MNDTFDPYREWLDIEYAGARPNNYELLGLTDFEGDLARIRSAADAAKSRVRGFRPGAHAAEWADLLDELAKAKETLSEAGRKQEYDARLQQERMGQRPRPTSPAPRGAPPAPTTAGAERWLSGSPETTAPQAIPPQTNAPQAIAPQVPASTTIGNEAAIPTVRAAPVGGAPMALPATGGAPQAPPLATPHSVPVAAPARAPMPAATQPPGAVDPMAPVAGITFAGPNAAAPLATPVQPDAPLQPLPAPSAQAATVSISGSSSIGGASVPATAAAQLAAPGLHRQDPLAGPNPSTFGQATARARTASQSSSYLGVMVVAVLLAVGLLLFAFSPFRERLLGNADTAESPPTPPVDMPPVGPRPLPPYEPPTHSIPPLGPVPRHVPEPAPVPTPTPVPVPTPTPVPVPTPAERAALGAAMQATRQALADRNLPLAMSKLAESEQLAKLPEHVAMAARLRDLYECVFQFWKGVSAGMAQLNSTGELQINNTIVAIVESDNERIVIRVAGRNRRYVLKELPSGLAMAIARNWFDETQPDTIVYQGAFLAVDPNADVERARAKWQEAAARGAKVDELMQVLDDDYEL